MTVRHEESRVMRGCAVVLALSLIRLRHQQVLAGLGLETVLVSRRAGQDLSAVLPGWDPTHVVIENEISGHLSVRDVDGIVRGPFARERVV